MQAKLRSKTHRCLVGFIIVMLSTPLLFIVNRPCYTLWYYGYIITLVKAVIYKSLINKYRLYGDWNKTVSYTFSDNRDTIFYWSLYHILKMNKVF